MLRQFTGRLSVFLLGLIALLLFAGCSGSQPETAAPANRSQESDATTSTNTGAAEGKSPASPRDESVGTQTAENQNANPSGNNPGERTETAARPETAAADNQAEGPLLLPPGISNPE